MSLFISILLTILISFNSYAQQKINYLLVCSSDRNPPLTIYTRGNDLNNDLKMLAQSLRPPDDIFYLKGSLRDTSFYFTVFNTTSDGDIINTPAGEFSGSWNGSVYISQIRVSGHPLHYICKKARR